MKKRDIEALLSTGEFRNLDFKETHLLTKDAKREITKDLMAFSNISDGGRIIIGVKEIKNDGNDPRGMHYELTGVEPEHLATWTHDHLADSVRQYADPYVEFAFETVPVNGKSCLVIRIQEFEEVPVICKKDYGDTLRCGAIYTRTKGKRESAEVRSQTEIREISELAVQKGLKKFNSTVVKAGLSFTGTQSNSEKFEKQLEGF